jgi:hypothetical protein
MSNEFCIVNFSNGGWYQKGQQRLSESLTPYGHTFLAFTEYSEINCEPHTENPYAFKIYSILKARELGFERVFWMDSSAWAIKSLLDIDNIIKDNGYFLEYDGGSVGNWTNDYTLNYFNESRNDMMKVPTIVAGICGFNFDDELSTHILYEWKKSADNGCFKGSWNNNNLSESGDARCLGHRHDLSSLSILTHQFELKAQNPNTYLQYLYPNIDIRENAYILLQGM